MTPTYLVQYGRPGFVGWFRGPALATALGRSERVVVRSPRGLELGTVLCEPADRFADAAPTDGEVIRPATREDAAAESGATAIGQSVLAVAETAAGAAGLPLAFVDVEAALDGAAVILHAIPWAACDATSLLADLSTQFGRAVRLLDLSRPVAATDPPTPAEVGCGKPGCGSGGGGCSSCGTSGGCSTGSCSKGQVKSADELTAYFTDLRQKMEAAGLARTPLV